MALSDLLRAILLRWRLMLAIIVGMLLLTILWTALSPRRYIASANLLIDARAPDPVASADTAAKAPGAVLATEAKIVRSAVIAERAARDLGLMRDPAWRARWQSETGGTQSLPGWTAATLLGGLDVGTNITDNILTINYTASTAERAALLANAFAAAYGTERLAMSTDPARTYANWFQKRMAEVRGRLEASQSALSAFQRQRGIISTGSIDAESTRLGELSSQLSNAEAQAADARARATVGGANLPEVQQSAVIQGLRAQIATKSAQLQQLRAELGGAHPTLRAAAAELSELQTRLGSETGKTSGSLGAAQAASTSREGQIRGLLAAQRSRMLALADDRSQLEVLESDAASARRQYDAVTEQLATMRLRSTLPATNVRALDRAEAPLLPASPDVVTRMVMATILSFLVAVAVAAALEWRRPRIRSLAAIRELSGAPVLGMARIGRSTPRLSGATSS